MKKNGSANAMGLRLPRRVLRALKDRGIFAQTSVGLHCQHLAKRYVVRGVESGGAVGDVGHYVTFARDDGQPIECLHPVESIGVNGPHSVVVAPLLIRLNMLRKGHTYELLITRHAPSATDGQRRPLLEATVLFRGVHGRLESNPNGSDKSQAGTMLPTFYSLPGEEIQVPRRFKSAVSCLVKAVNCSGCSHSHYVLAKGKQQGRESVGSQESADSAA